MLDEADWRLLGKDIQKFQNLEIEPTDGEEINIYTSDLDKCYFCWDVVEKTANQRWYVPKDKTYCICEECFADFQDFFNWSLLSGYDIEWSMKRFSLTGTRRERIKQVLEYAGWNEKRSVDITAIMDYYSKRNIPLLESAKDFFREFYGIARKWYMEVMNLKWAADFTFDLFPYPMSHGVNIEELLYDDVKHRDFSEDYQAITSLVKGRVNLMGEIGYHYAGLVWIDEEGLLYLMHSDYENEIHIFRDVLELLEHELLGCRLESVAFKRE